MPKLKWYWYVGGAFLAWRTFEAYRGQVPIWASLARPFDSGKSVRGIHIKKHADLCAAQNPDWSREQCEEKARMSYPPMGIFGTPVAPNEPPADEGGGELVLGDRD